MMERSPWAAGAHPAAAGELDVRDVGACSCLLVRRAARRITQAYDGRLAPSGLTIGQFGMLALLHHAESKSGATSMKSLADALSMDRTTLNRSLQPLHSAGLIEIEADPRDRRARMLSLTDEGRTRLATAMPLWHAAQTEFAERIGPSTRLALNDLLERAAGKFVLS